MPSVAVSRTCGLPPSLTSPICMYSAQQPMPFSSTAFRFHAQEKSRLERDVQRLADFKAEFENLAESSLDDGESNRTQGNNGGGGGAGGSAAGCGDEKWKLRAKKIQKYAKWQLAEAENQVQHTRDLMLPPPKIEPQRVPSPNKRQL